MLVKLVTSLIPYSSHSFSLFHSMMRKKFILVGRNGTLQMYEMYNNYATGM